MKVKPMLRGVPFCVILALHIPEGFPLWGFLLLGMMITLCCDLGWDD